MAKGIAKYPIKRGSRYDSHLVTLVHDWTLEGLDKVDGGSEDDELTSRSADYAIAMISGGIHKYARLVVYSNAVQNGNQYPLRTVGGDAFELPAVNAGREDLARGYVNWMKMSEQETDRIDDDIQALNKPQASRHILPVEQLTAKEKADPNSGGEGAKTKKE